jgi:peptide/nickel transport system substrate-binding protein
MKNSRTALLILLSILSLSALFARGAREERPLRYGLSGNPDTLDPHKTAGTLTFQVIKSVYDTLLEPDQEGKLKPALAESWSFSADGRNLTFRLRNNAVFHDGTPFTSRDVKATFLRILDKKTGSPHIAEFGAIAEILTPDPYTVVFRLAAPSAPLLSSLASGWSAILPAALIEAGHDFGSKPVGTGPFILESWVRDNKILLRRNSAYWMPGVPRIAGVDFHIILERSIQIQGLISGQIDLCDLNDDIDVPFLEKNPETKVQKSLTSLVMVLAMNTARPAFSDIRVRRAINHAIDKQKVLDIAYGGGVPVGTFMDYSDPYYKDFTRLYPYDPEKARGLLEEAGITKDMVFELALPQNYDPHVRAGQLYQEMLGKAGLNVRIKLVDWSTWISDVYRNANYDLTVIGHTGKLDPDGRLAGYGTERMYVRWVNPEAAGLIGEARVLPDFTARKAKYDRVLEIMAREVPFVFVGTSYRYVGMRRNVDGFIMQAKLDTFDFRNTSLNQ